MKSFLSVLVCVMALSAQGSQRSVKDELTYARKLTAWGMGEYAGIVLDRVKASAGDEYYAMKIATMVSTKKGIEDAEKLISTMDPAASKTWRMKLMLADGYYAWGKYPKVKEIYSAYLTKFTSNQKGIETVYKDSAYKYAQMLDVMGDADAALKAYDVALTTKLKKHEKRQVIANKAELMVQMAEKESGKERREALCREIDTLCDDLLWQRDLWFGRAIVMKAHVKMLRDDNEGAMALLQDYMPILQEIDLALREQSAD
jgi:tetratricopeptide (TPR) repeat protein